MVKDYLEYREGRMDVKTWIGSTRFILNQLRASGCDYPEYQMYEAYICHLEGRNEEAVEILKNTRTRNFQGKSWSLPEFICISVLLRGFIETRLRQCGGSRISICRKQTVFSCYGFSFRWTAAIKIFLQRESL